MNECKITMGKLDRVSKAIEIRIQDTLSGLIIVKAELSLSDLAEAITGLACVPGIVTQYPKATSIDNYNKKKIVKEVIVERPEGHDRSFWQTEVIMRIGLLPEVRSGEYKLLNDGVERQQNNPKGHVVTLYKYV